MNSIYQNSVFLLGTVAAEPEYTGRTKRGALITRVPVFTYPAPAIQDAASESDPEKTDGAHSVVFFGETAEQALELMSGDTVLIEGEVRSHSYRTASGITRIASEIIGRRFQVSGGVYE